jgi:inhibitor of cysteine peptidase
VISTTRPADAICTQVLGSFEETIALEVEGLPAGTYTVDVNGVIGSFTLDVDNSLP